MHARLRESDTLTDGQMVDCQAGERRLEAARVMTQRVGNGDDLTIMSSSGVARLDLEPGQPEGERRRKEEGTCLRAEVNVGKRGLAEGTAPRRSSLVDEKG